MQAGEADQRALGALVTTGTDMHRVSGRAVSAEPGRHRLLVCAYWLSCYWVLALEVTREAGRNPGEGGVWIQPWVTGIRAAGMKAPVGWCGFGCWREHEVAENLEKMG